MKTLLLTCDLKGIFSRLRLREFLFTRKENYKNNGGTMINLQK